MNATLEQLVDEARSDGPHSIRAAARLMSVMTDEPQRLAELLAASHRWRQARIVVGVTGAPGSGKSTLVDRLVAAHRRDFPNRRVGIVAVDPSSPFTGGALLGDRVRMMRHATDERVFIRSLASRGQLGGLAVGAQGVVRIMGLLGCDAVFVETVGVGQSEVAIARNADLTMVVLAPGQGDSIQMLKAGLIEAGDVFVVNKADREDAIRLQQQLLGVLRRGGVGHGRPSSTPKPAQSGPAERPVHLCSATNDHGIDALAACIEAMAARDGAAWLAERQAQGAVEVRQALMREIERRIDSVMHRDEHGDLFNRLLRGESSFAEAAEALLQHAARATVRRPRTVETNNSTHANMLQGSPS
jgi:LAO/AO transport system kinase